jgi:hypothetical protein
MPRGPHGAWENLVVYPKHGGHEAERLPVGTAAINANHSPETMNLDWVDVVGCDSEAVRKIVLDHHCARWIYSLTDVQVRLTLFCFSWRRCSPALRH